jgi:hypothetical protein
MAMGLFPIAIFFGCATQTLVGADHCARSDDRLTLVQSDASRVIHSSSTLGNSSGLGSKAYCREPNTAGR